MDLDDALSARENAVQDEAIDAAIAAEQRAEGRSPREVAALKYGRENDMAESAVDDADRPPRMIRHTDLDSDPELHERAENDLDEQRQ